MAADQAFLDRLHRIETGKTWAPEGVLVEERGRKKKRNPVNARQKRVSFLLSMVLIWGLVWAFSAAMPGLYSQFLAGDFSAVTGMLDGQPIAEPVTDA